MPEFRRASVSAHAVYCRHSHWCCCSLLFGFVQKRILTWCWWQAVHLHAEVVLEEEEANDGEEVDEEDGEHGSEEDGAAIARHALNHVEKRLLADHKVKQLIMGWMCVCGEVGWWLESRDILINHMTSLNTNQ